MCGLLLHQRACVRVLLSLDVRNPVGHSIDRANIGPFLEKHHCGPATSAPAPLLWRLAARVLLDFTAFDLQSMSWNKFS